ncbi:MAG: GNAT family N-acetyltransferase [Acidimicrobiia bacterium]
MTVRTALPRDTSRVAELHADRISEGFLATLGPTFLRLLYRRAVRSPHAFVLVATDGEPSEENVIGFVAGAHDLKRFYRTFLVHDGVVAAAAAAPRLLRSFRRVAETLRYPASTDELPSAEILAVAVDARCTGRGIGHRLVDAATREFGTHGAPAVKVVAGSGNQPAIRLYEGCGFARHRTIAVHGDAPSEVLVWPSP